jgi:hypothetical protein
MHLSPTMETNFVFGWRWASVLRCSNVRSLRGNLISGEIEKVPVETDRPVFVEETDNASSLPWVSGNSHLARFRDFPCVVVPADRIDTSETSTFSLLDLFEVASSEFLGQSFQFIIVCISPNLPEFCWSHIIK